MTPWVIARILQKDDCFGYGDGGGVRNSSREVAQIYLILNLVPEVTKGSIPEVVRCVGNTFLMWCIK